MLATMRSGQIQPGPLRRQLSLDAWCTFNLRGGDYTGTWPGTDRICGLFMIKNFLRRGWNSDAGFQSGQQ
jgi:hypothetical protein